MTVLRKGRHTGVVLALLALGIGLRVAHYAARRPLWTDEAMLSLNVAGRTAGGLLHPLDYAQSAPPLFLLGERILVRLGGVNELTLRALPFTAGIVLLLALWPVARRIAGPSAALLAVAIAALSPLLTYYANEAKPYGIDALVTIVLCACVMRVLDAPAEAFSWRMLAVAGTIAVWASSPSVFVLAGAVAALLASPRVRKSDRFFQRMGGTALVWGASFGTVFAAVLRHSSGDAYLDWFFDGTFLTPTAPHFLAALQRAVGSTLNQAFFSRELFEATVPSALYALLGVALGVCLVGLSAIRRRSGASASIVLAAPIVVTFAASAARLYPSSPPRFLGFAVPLLAIMAAAGTVEVTRKLRVRGKPVALAVFTTLFLLPATYSAVTGLRGPYAGGDNARSVIRAFEQSPRSREAVYIGANGIPEWLFYTTNWDAPDTARLAFYAWASRSPHGPAKQNGPSRGRTVAREGFELTVGYRGRREVVGLFSGIAVRPVHKNVVTRPDEGWAVNEAARIRVAAAPCATVMALGSFPPEIEALHGALEQLGGRLTRVGSAAPTYQEYVCFEKDGAAGGR